MNPAFPKYVFAEARRPGSPATDNRAVIYIFNIVYGAYKVNSKIKKVKKLVSRNKKAANSAEKPCFGGSRAGQTALFGGCGAVLGAAEAWKARGGGVRADMLQ